MSALKRLKSLALAVFMAAAAGISQAQASEIDLNIPSLDVGYNIFGLSMTGSEILMYGLGICILGMLFGLYEFFKIKKIPAHESMLNVSHTIYETCKTYMKQQSKLEQKRSIWKTTAMENFPVNSRRLKTGILPIKLV